MFHVNGNTILDEYSIYWIGQYLIYLGIGLLFAFPVVELINDKISNEKLRIGWRIVKTCSLACLLVLDLSFAIAGGYNPFIYFNF